MKVLCIKDPHFLPQFSPEGRRIDEFIVKKGQTYTVLKDIIISNTMFYFLEEAEPDVAYERTLFVEISEQSAEQLIEELGCVKVEEKELA